MFTVIKIGISAIIIGLITAIASRFPTYVGMVAALPLVSILSLIWLYVEGQQVNSLAKFAFGVLEGLPFVFSYKMYV